MKVSEWIKNCKSGEFESADGLVRAGFEKLNGDTEESALERFVSSRKFVLAVTNPAILNSYEIICESAPQDGKAVRWNLKNPKLKDFRYDVYSFLFTGDSDKDMDFHVTVGRMIFGWNKNARYVVRTGLFDGEDSGKELFSSRTPFECKEFLNNSLMRAL